jgi:hypothetical protein
MAYSVVVEKNVYDTVIIGIVDDREVIRLYDRGERWIVGTSTCLTSDIQYAEEMVLCYAEAFRRMRGIQAKASRRMREIQAKALVVSLPEAEAHSTDKGF